MLSAFDIELLRFIHHGRIAGLDEALYILSYSASFVSIGIVIVFLVIALKKKTWKHRRDFLKMLAALVAAALISLVLKTVIARERPFITYPDIEKLSSGGSASFPSGHTLEAFAIAMALTLVTRKWRIAVAVFTWAVLVAYSRIALGVHYPSDVAGGVFIGLFTGWFFCRLLNNKRTSRQEIKKD
ncbi:MAG: phosphatase PAP2 family protein [Bacteroidales bacterium]|jgi:undecaprenyl-diphosphatase|nr:phosphatase PAP2 family protein [Bacteroidales bacterium]